MVDPETSEVVGIHIEAFQLRYIEDHPEYKDMPLIQHLLATGGESEPGDRQGRALAQSLYGGLMLDHGAVAAQ